MCVNFLACIQAAKGVIELHKFDAVVLLQALSAWHSIKLVDCVKRRRFDVLHTAAVLRVVCTPLIECYPRIDLLTRGLHGNVETRLNHATAYCTNCIVYLRKLLRCGIVRIDTGIFILYCCAVFACNARATAAATVLFYDVCTVHLMYLGTYLFVITPTSYHQ